MCRLPGAHTFPCALVTNSASPSVERSYRLAGGRADGAGDVTCASCLVNGEPPEVLGQDRRGFRRVSPAGVRAGRPRGALAGRARGEAAKAEAQGPSRQWRQLLRLAAGQGAAFLGAESCSENADGIPDGSFGLWIGALQAARPAGEARVSLWGGVQSAGGWGPGVPGRQRGGVPAGEAFQRRPREGRPRVPPCPRWLRALARMTTDIRVGVGPNWPGRPSLAHRKHW